MGGIKNYAIFFFLTKKIEKKLLKQPKALKKQRESNISEGTIAPSFEYRQLEL